MSGKYDVKPVPLKNLPKGVEADLFDSAAWAVFLDSDDVAYCVDQKVAETIASHDLATKTTVLGQKKWFPLKMDGEIAGYCLGSVLLKANKFLGNGS